MEQGTSRVQGLVAPLRECPLDLCTVLGVVVLETSYLEMVMMPNLWMKPRGRSTLILKECEYSFHFFCFTRRLIPTRIVVPPQGAEVLQI